MNGSRHGTLPLGDNVLQLLHATPMLVVNTTQRCLVQPHVVFQVDLLPFLRELQILANKIELVSVTTAKPCSVAIS